MKLSYFFKLINAYQADINFSKNSKVKIFNFWPLDEPEQLWFTQFINGRHLLPAGKSISIYSVFGDRYKMKFDRFRHKIFFTGENTIYRPNYTDHCLGNVNISLGSAYISAANYLRLPLWYLYFIKPHFSYQDVKKWIDDLNNQHKCNQKNSRKFCCLVAGHDPEGKRTAVFNLLSNIAAIDSGGQLLKNTDALTVKYQNDKQLFLKNYQFNICLENSNLNGYVTEKIFEAIQASCLPIYWGSDLKPEPDILNQQRILFYDPADVATLYNVVKELHDAPAKYKDFYMQDVFEKTAAEVIYQKLQALETRIKELWKNQ